MQVIQETDLRKHMRCIGAHRMDGLANPQRRA
jgi:hypothetical protein